MIEIKNISKSYGDRLILDSISLKLESEETHVILGESGCGKSTLLRILLGLVEGDSGTVRVGERSVTSSSHQELCRQVGYVIQDGGLFPHLTAFQNVGIRAEIAGWDSDRITSRINELSDLVSLEKEILNRYPQQLSGGQKQRVALMRALMLDPSCLLLDEPLGALDPIIRSLLQGELKMIFNRLKKTVVLVTHDIGEAVFFGHTITLMNQGKILQHGPFSQFVQNPADPFVTKFLRAQKPPVELESIK